MLLFKQIHRFIFLTVFALVSFHYSLATCNQVVVQSNYLTVFKSGQKNVVVRSTIDLGGMTLSLPDNISIEFGRHGKLINGEIVGKNTELKKMHNGCVGVKMAGSWVLNVIKDSFFDSNILSDTQVLDNISHLQSDDINNVIHLTNPLYKIKLDNKHRHALSLSSNTRLYIKSKLCVLENNLVHYAVISIGKNHDIEIDGGEIIGDVGKHRYIQSSSNQWGFGIQLNQSENIKISNVKISKCIGDGIYIGGGDGNFLGDYSGASRNVVIQGVIADDNRRQGISITCAYNVLLKDCVFSNTGKTEFVRPGCGIDIEPNLGQTVGKVVVSGCLFLHNDKILNVSIGGYRVEGDKCNVEDILFENCTVTGILSVRTGSVIIRKCTMKTLVIHLAEMPKEKVFFDRCKISGGNGIIVRTTCDVTRDENYPVYNFQDCIVSVADIKRNTIISTLNHKGDEKGLLNFSGCKFSMPSTDQNYDLVQEKCVYDFSFEECDINCGGRVLHNRGFSFSRCNLNCSYVDLIPIKKPCVVKDCTINASDSKNSIVFTPVDIQTQKLLYVVRGNFIIGHTTKSIDTKGIKAEKYDISGNKFSR